MTDKKFIFLVHRRAMREERLANFILNQVPANEMENNDSLRNYRKEYDIGGLDTAESIVKAEK